MRNTMRAIEITVGDKILPSIHTLTGRKVTAVGRDAWGRIEITHINATGMAFTNNYAPEDCVTVQR